MGLGLSHDSICQSGPRVCQVSARALSPGVVHVTQWADPWYVKGVRERRGGLVLGG